MKHIRSQEMRVPCTNNEL